MAKWSWNRTYKDLYEKAKKLIMKDTCMKSHDTSNPLYLETDASGVGLGASLLQMWEGVNCTHDNVLDNMFHCPILLPVNVNQAQRGGRATLREKHWEYYTGSTMSITTLLGKKYMSSLTMSHLWPWSSKMSWHCLSICNTSCCVYTSRVCMGGTNRVLRGL